MSLRETQVYTVEIILSTRNGELPTNAEVKRLVEDQMGGDLDDTTGLWCIAVRLLDGRPDPEEAS